MKRIVFFVSSLEPGADGVGDYVRRLAGSLAQCGVESRLIAINDRHISGVSLLREEQVPGIFSVRAAAAAPWEQRVPRLRSELATFDPDWISLQFVCFGFHPRGIVRSAIEPLYLLCAGRRLHWMFHELWLGEELGHPFRFRVMGLVQRYYITRLYRRLQPKVVHTSNRCYASILASNGICAEVLPIFGGIPPRPQPRESIELLASLGLGRIEQSSAIILGIFGSISIQWDPRGWLDNILSESKLQGKRVIVLGMGRLHGRGAAKWTELERLYSMRAQVHHVGEQSADQLSDLLQVIDYGVATTQADLVGKSSAVATMLEHGKPVLLPVKGRGESGIKYADERNHAGFGLPMLVPEQGVSIPARVAQELAVALNNAANSLD